MVKCPYITGDNKCRLTKYEGDDSLFVEKEVLRQICHNCLTRMQVDELSLLNSTIANLAAIIKAQNK